MNVSTMADTYPLGAKSIDRISFTWPSSTIAVRPVRMSHTRPIASKPLLQSALANEDVMHIPLTLKPPALRHPGKPTRRPPCCDPPVSTAPFSTLRPIASMSRRKTPSQGIGPTDGRLSCLLDSGGHLMLPEVCRCSRLLRQAFG